MREVKEKKAGEIPVGFNVNSHAHYFQGKCVELFLKCLLVASGTIVTRNGALIPEINTHDLLLLCEKAQFNTTSLEKATLEKLTEAITFWGTYPIPTNFTKWRREVNGMEGIPPVWFWTPADTNHYLNLVGRLREQAGPIVVARFVTIGPN